MLKKTITYTDYDGNPRTEEHFFNLNKSELTMLEMSEQGGFEKRMRRIIQAQDAPAIMDTFRDIIKRSYGQKSPDGRRFIKSEALVEEFEQTEAYSELFMELCTDANAASDFIKGIMPQDIVAMAEKSERDKLPE